MKEELKTINLVPENNLIPENSIYFTLKNEVTPIMKISNGKFYWKDAEVEDIHNIYERFNEWLTKAENK